VHQDAYVLLFHLTISKHEHAPLSAHAARAAGENRIAESQDPALLHIRQQRFLRAEIEGSERRKRDIVARALNTPSSPHPKRSSMRKDAPGSSGGSHVKEKPMLTLDDPDRRISKYVTLSACARRACSGCADATSPHNGAHKGAMPANTRSSVVFSRPDSGALSAFPFLRTPLPPSGTHRANVK